MICFVAYCFILEIAIGVIARRIVFEQNRGIINILNISRHLKIDDANILAKDHLVTALPLFGDIGSLGDQYAGLLPVDKTGSSFLFYWLFETSEDSLNKPLVIWLNGGPGI